MNKQNYSAIEELIIGTPIEQNINALGQKSGGRFETRNMQKPTMQVSEFRALTETEVGFHLNSSGWFKLNLVSDWLKPHLEIQNTKV